MKLVIVGVNHASLNMDQRKEFYFRDSDKWAFSTQMLDAQVEQILILSTCNRSEVYAMVSDSFDENVLKAHFLAYFHQSNHEVNVFSGQQALTYLLEVACGLHSMVIGEDQILHQIREALHWTMENHFSGKELNYIFQNVIRFAREMRKKYAMSEHPLSVSYIGYQSLYPYLKPNDRIMICGMGEMARLMIEYLKDYHLLLVNRTQAKVMPYLNEKRRFVRFEDRYAALAEVDVVVSATGSPHTIFDAQKITTSRPLFFLDLALPRDVDENVRYRLHTRLVDMDDLQGIAANHLEKRQALSRQIQKASQLESESLSLGLQNMKSDPVIEKMQARYLRLSDETFELLKRKLHLNSHEEYILHKVLQTSFLSLMKEPVRLLKSQDKMLQEQYIALVGKMIGEKENEV